MPMTPKNLRRLLVSSFAVSIAIAGYWTFDYARFHIMHALPQGLRRFSVWEPSPSCGRWKETMPKARDPNAYGVYMEARKLWRSKIEWQLTHEEAQRILTSVQSAADKGDWGARALMAHFYREGLGPLPENEVLVPDADKAVAITRIAVAAGQAWAFYDLGVAHEHGYGGAVYDEDIAWAYYLRAAELGSPEGQMALADAYSQVRKFDDEEAMLKCAFVQGHGAAAYKLAIRQQVFGRHTDAASLFQDGVKFGHEDSAASLEILFRNGYWSWKEEAIQLGAAGFVPDQERATRYKQIGDALRINPDLRLRRLDDVLPLPPAPLPQWRGIKDALDPEPQGPPTY